VLTARDAEIVGAEERAHLLPAGDASYRWPTFRSLGLRLLDRGESVPAARRHGDSGGDDRICGSWRSCRQHNGQPPAIEDSLAGMVGRTIEPVIKPLGFNWKIGIGLITSLAARE
jgi:ferrous iron transport protein B